MKLFLVIVPLALLATIPQASTDGCVIRVTEAGSLVTLQGVVNAQSWPRGTYAMTIQARQGGNLSLSRQAGAFDDTEQAADGALVLSASTVHVGDGGQLVVNLTIDDGTRNASCSLDYGR